MNIESVITEYQAALRAFLVSRLRNPADADDLVQEVFAKTLQSAHTLTSDTKLKPWLFQIANNALIDHYRRQQREAAVNPDDLWYNSDQADAEHAFAPCLNTFLSALPPESGELLRAVELDGRPQKALAADLDISYSTLKSRVQSARRQLRGLFDQCCEVVFAKDGTVVDYTQRSGGCDDC
ncbi:MAG: sigma-70 family RNA polymerase sigma factor [Pseudomonadota bacterium]